MKAFEGHVSVLPERDGADRPEPDRVAAVHLDEIERVDHVPDGLRDLPLVDEQPAMYEELLRNLVACCQEQSRPEDTMEAQDVLGQQVAHLGPELLAEVLALSCVGQCAHIIDERIDPHVDDLALVPGDRDAPELARAAEAEVL